MPTRDSLIANAIMSGPRVEDTPSAGNPEVHCGLSPSVMPHVPTRTAIEPSAGLFTFTGGTVGIWSVLDIAAVTGESLSAVQRLDVVQGDDSAPPADPRGILRGVTSNVRYATAAERAALAAAQADLDRPEAVRAALIPIRKHAAWWALPQDERRRIFEERSRHIETGPRYQPPIARRLQHGRNLVDVRLAR
jgi:hypothetical protein